MVRERNELTIENRQNDEESDDFSSFLSLKGKERQLKSPEEAFSDSIVRVCKYVAFTLQIYASFFYEKNKEFHHANGSLIVK